MAEVDIGTRAPENDEDEGTTKPQSGPSKTTGPGLSEHCVSDSPLPPGEASTGEISKLADVEVYITKPNDYPHSPSKLLLFLTNGTGIHSLNNQIQADKFASEGFLVVMPDLFEGDPAPNSTSSQPEEDHPSIIEQVKLRAAETAKSFLLDMWLARHTAEKVMPRIHKVVEAVKEEFADAVANGGGIYAVGYCFGGKYVLLLGGGEESGQTTSSRKLEDEEQGKPGKDPIIKAGAIAHGTQVTLDDLNAIKAPISMVCVENDQLFPDEVREEGRKSLQANGVKHEIEVYKDMPHGFAVVGEYGDQNIRDAQKRAFDQMLMWLKNH
ncbi:MAG: hypothetical protein M1816_001745 [Peltula sp. TS41687]|nr:MAG: hypothetical protein M1816_001745 [Peltula sp. TS41687]